MSSPFILEREGFDSYSILSSSPIRQTTPKSWSKVLLGCVIDNNIFLFLFVYIDCNSISGIYGSRDIYKIVQQQSCKAKILTIHAGNIDLEEFKRCRNGAEGLYVLHRDLGEWYFSFQELATVVSREVRPSGL